MPVHLTIRDVVYRGKGLARHEGCVVFVPHTLPGEMVRVEITRRKPDFAEARLLEVRQASPHRIEPACPLAPACPGCVYQHVSYEEEVRLKAAQLADVLRRVGGVGEAPGPPPEASPAPLGYRNKIELHAGLTDGRTVLGYVAEDNRTVIEVPACPLARLEINERLARLRADAAFMGGLRPRMRVTLRYTAADGALHWIGRRPPRGPCLRERTALGEVQVPRGSFFQVNLPVADRLVARVAETLRETGAARVLDLYCGVGVFALATAEAGAGDVLGIDADEAAVAAAGRNAAERHLRNVRFVAGAASRELPRALSARAAERIALIVDPPRTGLERPVVRTLAERGPPDLLYVSCAADTLARDVRHLVTAGYTLRRTQMVDMFPRTPFFESVTWLTRP